MDIVDQAIAFATKAHCGQKRKMSNTPYILHPLEVAAIIATITDDREIMAAGLLHDTIEDCGVDPKTIKKKFGSRVSALVQSESEDRMDRRPGSVTWMERKRDSLLMLKNTKELDVKILWLGDKLSNIRSFYRAYKTMGNAFFEGLNQKDPEKQGWYYKTIAEYIPELKNTFAYQEYVYLVKEVFG